MDIGTIHSLWTIVLFGCFIGVVWWAYGKKRKSRFDEAANLIFADEEQKTPSEKQGVTK